MDTITLKMPAKINLSIDVLNKRSDGYHNVKMVMQAIDLYDTVCVKKQSNGITVECPHPNVPEDERNIAWRATELFYEALDAMSHDKNGSMNHDLSNALNQQARTQLETSRGAHIRIEKNIPVFAGLGGGSTNAAGVLIALNKLHNNCLNDKQLLQISKRIGADVAFFLRGGTQISEGIGEMLTELPDLTGVHLVLVKPDFSVSTPWVYQNLDFNQLGERPDTAKVVKAVKENNISSLALNLRNVLESVTVKQYSEVGIIMEKMMQKGALASRMTGSGPTVFGIFSDEKMAKLAQTELLKEYTQVYHNKTIGKGSY